MLCSYVTHERWTEENVIIYLYLLANYVVIQLFCFHDDGKVWELFSSKSVVAVHDRLWAATYGSKGNRVHRVPNLPTTKLRTKILNINFTLHSLCNIEESVLNTWILHTNTHISDS